jgi:predicted acetylornithine/succinylornithine family transaminase
VASKKLKNIIEQDREYLFQNYGSRKPVCFVNGRDSFLYDQDGKEYIDFFSGVAVSNLGYGNRAIATALRSQLDSIIHSSNHFYNLQQIRAAALISELSFPGKTLFSNSGTEANEAAIKLARRYGLSLHKDRYQIITFVNSFHGRTMGSMTATGQKKIHDGFGPLPRGFVYLPYNDINAFRKEVKRNRDVAAVMLEPIQGEGGVLAADKDFVREVAEICRNSNILLIIDEVQTGFGRTGTLFGYQQYDIIPDIITLAKAIGGGLPLGAIHAKSYLADHLGAGAHGSTFGGNHMACAAAEALMKELKKPALLKNVAKVSQYLMEELKRISASTALVKEVRGMGLIIGIEMTRPGMDIVLKALEKGLVINCTAEKVIRVMPPLNIPLSVAKKGMGILKEILMSEGGAS